MPYACASTRHPSRDPLGRFMINGVRTELQRKRAISRRRYCLRKEMQKKSMFDSFAKVFFLVGSAADWLPPSSSSGPLVHLAEVLFKPIFLLGRCARSERLHLVFFDGDPNDVRDITHRVSTRNYSLESGTTSRVKAFRGRRLPLIENYAAEVEPVRDMIQKAFDKDALKVPSVAAAFSICIKVIRGYVFVNGRRAYVGYPRFKESSCSNSTLADPIQASPSISTVEEERGAGSIGSSPVGETNDAAMGSAVSQITASAEEQGQDMELESTEADEIVGDGEAQSSDPFFAETFRLLQAAQDDYAFHRFVVVR